MKIKRIIFLLQINIKGSLIILVESLYILEACCIHGSTEVFLALRSGSSDSKGSMALSIVSRTIGSAKRTDKVKEQEVQHLYINVFL